MNDPNPKPLKNQEAEEQGLGEKAEEKEKGTKKPLKLSEKTLKTPNKNNKRLSLIIKIINTPFVTTRPIIYNFTLTEIMFEINHYLFSKISTKVSL